LPRDQRIDRLKHANAARRGVMRLCLRWIGLDRIGSIGVRRRGGADEIDWRESHALSVRARRDPFDGPHQRRAPLGLAIRWITMDYVSRFTLSKPYSDACGTGGHVGFTQ
jgi:hypothetical protein